VRENQATTAVSCTRKSLLGKESCNKCSESQCLSMFVSLAFVRVAVYINERMCFL